MKQKKINNNKELNQHSHKNWKFEHISVLNIFIKNCTESQIWVYNTIFKSPGELIYKYSASLLGINKKYKKQGCAREHLKRHSLQQDTVYTVP